MHIIYIISHGDYNIYSLSSYTKRSAQSGTRELTQKNLDIPYPRLNPMRAK